MLSKHKQIAHTMDSDERDHEMADAPPVSTSSEVNILSNPICVFGTTFANVLNVFGQHNLDVFERSMLSFQGLARTRYLLLSYIL